MCHSAIPIVKRLAPYLDTGEGSDFQRFFQEEMNRRISRGRRNIAESDIEKEIDWLKVYNSNALEAMVRDVIKEYNDRGAKKKRSTEKVIEIYA